MWSKGVLFLAIETGMRLLSMTELHPISMFFHLCTVELAAWYEPATPSQRDHCCFYPRSEPVTLACPSQTDFDTPGSSVSLPAVSEAARCATTERPLF
jgi:hypothetical protein